MAAIFTQYLIWRLRKHHRDIYDEIVGDIDDSYLTKKGQNVRFRHKLRLDILILSGRHVKEIGYGSSVIYIVLSLGYDLTLIYFVLYVLHASIRGLWSGTI